LFSLKILIFFFTFENLGLTISDTVIQRSGSMFSLFLYLVLMAVIAEKCILQRYMALNARNASLSVLTKS